MRADEVELCAPLDALGHHLEVEAARHGEDRVHHRDVVRAVGDAGDEAAVDLQDIEAEALEVRERRVAGAEVIERQAHAHDAQARELLHHLDVVVEHHALRDLEFEHARRHVVFGEQLGEPRRQALPELHARDVYGEHAGVDAGGAPARPHAAGLLEDPVADLQDLAARLGERHENRRLDEAALRVLPAQQHLGAVVRLARRDHDRLEVQRELAALDRLLQVLLEAHALAQAHVHLLGEEDGRAVLRALRLVHRLIGVHHQRLDAVAAVGE